MENLKINCKKEKIEVQYLLFFLLFLQKLCVYVVRKLFLIQI